MSGAKALTIVNRAVARMGHLQFIATQSDCGVFAWSIRSEDGTRIANGFIDRVAVADFDAIASLVRSFCEAREKSE